MNENMPLIVPIDVPGSDPVDLPSLVRQHAGVRPDRSAIIFGHTVTTWAKLALAMDRTATHLIRMGLGHGNVLASLGGVTRAHLTLYLGTLAAGGWRDFCAYDGFGHAANRRGTCH